MTKEELAEMLNGRAHGRELSRDEARKAMTDRLVVVYGASDDLMEFEGAIRDEVGCFNGGEVLLDAEGVIDRFQIEDDDDEAIAEFVRRKPNARVIESRWCKEPGICWTYVTSIPRATFFILDGTDRYCRGIVFSLDDLGGAA